MTMTLDLAPQLNKTIFLVGMPGSGKTVIGQELAKRHDWQFVDSDEQIEAHCNMPVSDIFATKGEIFFREREHIVIKQLVDLGSGHIISTGGGAFIQTHNRALIQKEAISLWLDVSEAILWNRVKRKNSRPLLNTKNPRERLKKLYNERVPIYEQAHIHFKLTQKLSIAQVTAQITELLNAKMTSL